MQILVTENIKALAEGVSSFAYNIAVNKHTL